MRTSPLVATPIRIEHIPSTLPTYKFMHIVPQHTLKMAIPTKSTLLPLTFLLLLLATATALGGGKLGGRTLVKNVESDKEIQDLGIYCVQEYNRKLQQQGNSRKLLIFSQVVKAETQVVTGTKYYLTISATTRGSRRGGSARSFDAVVVVKPWLQSKELLNFAPTPTFH